MDATEILFRSTRHEVKGEGERSMRVGILGSGLMGGKLETVFAKASQAMIRC